MPRFHTRTEDPGTLTDSSLHLRIIKFVVARNTTRRKFLTKFTKREGRSELYCFIFGRVVITLSNIVLGIIAASGPFKRGIGGSLRYSSRFRVLFRNVPGKLYLIRICVVDRSRTVECVRATIQIIQQEGKTSLHEHFRMVALLDHCFATDPL